MKQIYLEKARELVMNEPKALDLERKYSHKSAKNFLDEQMGTHELSFTVENASKDDVVVCFGSILNSQFATEAQLLDALSANALLKDGVIYTDSADGKCTVSSDDSNRSINEAIRYISNTPTRMVKVHLDSSTVAENRADTSNYSAKMKTTFVSPWEKPQDEYISLRTTQSNRANSPQFAEVNFIEIGKKAIVSNENFLMFTVKAGTKLSMTWDVGKQYSKAQEFYRAIKDADRLTARLDKEAGSCGC